MIEQLRRKLPRKSEVVDHWSVKPFAHLLNHPRHWHIHRTGVARGIFIGLVCAWNPLPFTQMLVAAAWAALSHANIPTAVAITWITNPFTAIPLFFGAYWFGDFILRLVVPQWESAPFSLSGLLTKDSALIPIAFGAVLIAFGTAYVGQFLTQFLWRRHIRSRWQKRQRLRTALKNA